MKAGAVKIRMDFLNGETRLIDLPLSLLADFAGHGGEQKFGDNLTPKNGVALSPEDMVANTDDLAALVGKGEWSRVKEGGGGGVSGASVVIQAILEVLNRRNAEKGKPLTTVEKVKEHIQKLLEAGEKDGLTRKALYDSFRAPGTDTAAVIKRIEEEKAAKSAKPELASAALAGMEE